MTSTGHPSTAGPHVVLLRHGETEWSRTGRHTGRSDIALTERGREQARALVATLQRECPAGPGLVLSSPLVRARETARLAGLEPEEEPDLQEWDYGDLEGITTREWRERHGDPGWTVWQQGPPGGEALADLGARVDRVLERVCAGLDEERPVVVVAHGHLLRVLAARWLHLDPSVGAVLRLDPATVSVLGFEHGLRALLRWNAPVESLPV